MAFYRCYKISQGGRILGIENFHSPDDADAYFIADRIRSNGGWYDVELWEGRRKVSRPRPIVLKLADDREKLAASEASAHTRLSLDVMPRLDQRFFVIRRFVRDRQGVATAGTVTMVLGQLRAKGEVLQTAKTRHARRAASNN